MSSTNWPASLPFTTSTVADSSTITRNAAYWYTNVSKPISDACVSLIGDPGWTYPALSGGWTHFSAVYNLLSYRTYGLQVIMRGLGSSGATGVANPIFTLPVALRPSAQLTFLVGCGNGVVEGLGVLFIDTSGRVYVNSYLTGGGNNNLSLEDVYFMAD